MVFVQSYRLGDLGGDVVWELAITPNYQELFDSTDKREIDIIDFGDVKFEGDASDLSQKEDEFDFTLFESRAKTDDDILAINLLKSAEYSDVWVALFEYEPTRIEDFAKNQCDFKNRIFSGLIRRKITGNDNIWYGEAWDSNPRPIREWKFSAQALGEALLDSVKLASSFDENGKLIPGALQDAQISTMDCQLIGYGNFIYRSAISLSNAITALLNVAQTRISKKIPGFGITTRESQSGYEFGYNFSSVTEKIFYSKRLKLFTKDVEDFTDEPIIDSRLMKYPTEENDGVTVKLGYSLAWHRFDNLTTLLYKVALCFGCRLRIYHTGKSGFEIAFEPIAGNKKEVISIFDATKANIDLQEANLSNSDKYYCQATDFNNEGLSNSRIENGAIVSDDNIKSKSAPLPLSISLIMQKVSRKGTVGYVYQNSTDGYLSSVDCAWSGIILSTGTSGPYAIATAVAATVDNKAVWYKTLADCLNSKVSANNTYYKSEYSIELPYIKSFQSSRVAASLANLALFKSIEIDGKTYCINSITIKPSDGIVSIKAANSDKYGFAQPPEPPIYGKIAPPEITQDDYIEESRVDSFVAFSSVKKNDYLMLLGNLLVAKFRLGSEPAWERAIGVAQNDALKGQVVYVKNTGFVEIENAAFDNAGRAIYLRAGDSGNFYSTDRALKRIQGEEVIDLKVGIAVSATKFRLTEPEAYILM